MFFLDSRSSKFKKYRNILEGLNFYDLLGLLDVNNFKYYPIIVDLLSDIDFFNGNSRIFRSVFRPGDQDLLRALNEIYLILIIPDPSYQFI